MDNLAGKLAAWFGTSAFILAHVIWFSMWVFLHFTVGFDPEWSALTVIVSLEAIFLSLFILMAENVEAARDAKSARRDLRTRNELLEEIESLKKNR